LGTAASSRFEADDWLSRALLSVGGLLGRYHRHQVLHLERLERPLRRGRRVILVGNHALNIVDPLLFVKAVYDELHVVPRFMAHAAWFRTPLMREVASRYQVVPARARDAAEALERDGVMMLFPGAVREAAVRDYRSEPYRLKWEGRRGFVRLALEHDADVFFVAAVGNDEAYYQSRLPIPERLLRLFANGDAERYRGARFNFGLLGPQLLPGVFPLPVRMTHVVSEPIDLGDRRRALEDEQALEDLHQRVWAHCQAELDRAVAERGVHSDPTDAALRQGQAWLRQLGL
jgi:1-acyl-sn-glycerol-3-phosphate acyltransferase